ncbi:alpha/beta hydrolase [Nodosilinea sp. PGN35]|uniref:alpha/beta hydrolase n=1 Tax=Nodosilinea sp. PGN35 TaxID=3020489 RepID=UPI0023B2C413|nr:alpha/beta hydrolase [Nodosilinea sp. TSF1-S3]MDF0369833.1 alpha/beta hydrolase [Nodosilinea sp. TSF1-S3]
MLLRHRPLRIFAAVVLGLGTAWATALPLRAADTIGLEFGPFSRSIPTESLIAFAATGEVDPQLAPFLRRLSPAQRQGLRSALNTSRPVNLVAISQWFNSPMGDRSLQFLGELAQTEAGLNGRQALRAAIVAAAAEDGDIALLDIVRHFPTGKLRVDVAQGLTVARQVQAEIAVTRRLVAAIQQQSEAAAMVQPVDLAALPDLTQPGPYGSRQVSLTLVDASRSRTYAADVFWPANLAALDGPLPVVVISHGLGDSRTSFFSLAAHAASHGLAVALPEHVGSNSSQKQALLTGLDRETFKARDFLDRPLDVSFLLDELERLNATTFEGRLDVSRVAAVGHSFGGYTALALGGATIDFERLARRCNPAANLLLDAAMVLECRALELQTDAAAMARFAQGTQDDRVKLVMAFAPVSNLFGPRGMAQVAVPVMLLGGEVDLVAPVVPQQVAAFSWLRGDDRYLYLGENTSHGPDFTRLASRFLYIDEALEQGIDEAIATTQGVNRSLVVAFSQVYLGDREAYRPFLSAAYVEAVSAAPFRLHLARELPPQAIERLGPELPGLE